MVLPVQESEEFCLEYIHSVHKRPVREFFRIEGQTILLFKTQFDTFGVGISHSVADGEVMTVQDGLVTIDNMKRVHPKGFVLRVGSIANQTLMIGDNKIPLLQNFETGSPVSIKLKQISIMHLIYRGRQ